MACDLLAKGRGRLFLVTELTALALHLGLFYGLVMYGGLSGAAVAFGVAQLLYLPVLFYVVYRLTGLRWTRRLCRTAVTMLGAYGLAMFGAFLLPRISGFALGVVVVVGEEVIYRGFLMSQIIKLLGTSLLALLLNVLITSIIFGLSHSYQGRSGPWSTGIIGACLGVIYILSGFNLWLPILVHGVINTVELILMSLGADKRLRELVWEKPRQSAG